MAGGCARPHLGDMARVLPFSALLPSLESHLLADVTKGPLNAPPRSAAVRPLLERVDPSAELVRWRSQGAVLRDARPALYLAEVSSPEGVFGGPPVRFLLCALTPEAAMPLEDAAYRPLSAQVEPTVTLAADDHGVLRALLEHAAESGERGVDGDVREQPGNAAAPGALACGAAHPGGARRRAPAPAGGVGRASPEPRGHRALVGPWAALRAHAPRHPGAGDVQRGDVPHARGGVCARL